MKAIMMKYCDIVKYNDKIISCYVYCADVFLNND